MFGHLLIGPVVVRADEEGGLLDHLAAADVSRLRAASVASVDLEKRPFLKN